MKKKYRDKTHEDVDLTTASDERLKQIQNCIYQRRKDANDRIKELRSGKDVGLGRTIVECYQELAECDQILTEIRLVKKLRRQSSKEKIRATG